MPDIEYSRINVSREDRQYMVSKFGQGDATPAKGVLIKRMREHIENLEDELEAML